MELTDRELKILMFGVKVTLDTFIGIENMQDDSAIAMHLYPVRRAMQHSEEYLPSDETVQVARKVLHDVEEKRAAMERSRNEKV